MSNSGFTFPPYFQGFLLPILSVFTSNNKHLQIFMNCGSSAVDSKEQSKNLKKIEIKIVLCFKNQANKHNQPCLFQFSLQSTQKGKTLPYSSADRQHFTGKGKWQGHLSNSFLQLCYLSVFSVMNPIITFCNECLPLPFSIVLVLHYLLIKCDLYGILSLQTNTWE